MTFLQRTAAYNIKLTIVADIDECAVITCLNGGTCLDRVGNFSCLCELGYTGPLCETGKRRPTTLHNVFYLTEFANTTC